MNILLSNDDGWRADGLRALAEALAGLGTLTVVAPDRNRSGASNSLTLDAPLRIVEAEGRWYAVNGTPTDCVHLAISGFLADEQQLVVSGINDGANLGDDVLYSGTVAAAMEGRFLGLPSIAVSLAGRRRAALRDRGARRARARRAPRPGAAAAGDAVQHQRAGPALRGTQGLEATRLGVRHRSERIVRTNDPRGRPMYWVGAPGGGEDAGPGTDFHAVEHGYASITPLQIDLTRHAALPGLEDWLRNADV